ncbi:MAG TPA: hypothetical protein ENJ29_10565 [Bacteroidetes bacterium]|nr:hypothetical protein [Bacteroidota bacterium]
MKQLAIGLVIGVALSITLGLIAGETFYKGKVVYVVVGSANIRNEPNGEKIGSVNKGTQLVVLEDSEKWTKVYTTGYIWKESLTGRREKLAGASYRALMIVVKEEKEAADILARLKNGADFKELAKEHSIDAATAARGGDLGEFYKGDFAPVIEEAILAIKPGELSSVIKSNIGYHLFKRIK